MSQNKSPIILFTPKYLADGFGFLSFISVIRNGPYTDFEFFRFSELKKKFPVMIEKASAQIALLSDQSLAEYKKALIKALKNVPSGQSTDTLIQKKIIRYLNETFLEGVKHWGQVPWYHQIYETGTNKLLKCPCWFLSNSTALKYKVQYTEEKGLQLIQYLALGKEIYLLSDFKRTKFLLEHKHQYFVLKPLDFNTVEWLDDLKIERLAFRPKEFLLQVVWKLEEKGYELDRNDCFQSKEINSIPQAMVLINEISNTFLQFVPCWNYEGIRLEGSWQAKTEVQRQGDLYLVYRNKSEETKLIEKIRSKHSSFLNQFNGRFFIHFDEAKKNNWFFSLYQEWIDQGVEILGLDLLEHFRYSIHKIATELQWKSSNGGYSTIFFRIQFGDELVKNKELQKVILAGQKNILLQDTSIGILTDEWLERYSLIIKHSRIEEEELVVSNWLLQTLDKELSDAIKGNIIPAQWLEKWLHWQKEDREIYVLPSVIRATLRPYQHKGFEWMCLLSEIESGACLSDDMGLGKTVQTISFLAWLVERYPSFKFLIACPASLIYNWKAEFEKFAPSFSVRLYKGGLQDLESFFASNEQILISTFGMVRSQIELLEIHTWGGVVVDESHNIKNPTALITRAVHRLKTKHRVALSGTPVMNNTFDLYSQLEFLVPGLLGSQEFFRREYANPIDKDGQIEKIQALSKITSPFIMRRTKKQVAKDLPEKIESILWCEMEDQQRALYEETKGLIRDSIFLNIKTEGLGRSKIGILAGITKLKQICCSPVLMKEHQEHIHYESIKLDILTDELENQLMGNKVLVFSQFKEMLHLIARQLRKSGIPHYQFDGDTPVIERQEMVNAFNEEQNDTRVFLISLKAGNTGLNLTAADYIFLIDPWWNRAVEQQAIDRTHRIGQTKHVFAYRMLCKNTIEERIHQLQEKKQWISDELIQAEEGFVKNLSEADVEYLFS
jgi:SNF2 family DNA or RNA helicase